MKKIIVIILILFLITGCTSTKEKTIQNETKEDIKIVENNINYEEEVEVISNEEEIIEYVENLNNNITEENLKDTNFKEKLKDNFIILTDFIFYGGTIKGKTFNELSTSAKEKVISVYETMDQKIEEFYPNYKEEISKTSKYVYTNLKDKLIEIKSSLTDKYIEKVGQDKYDEQLNSYNTKKEELKDKATPIIEKGKDKTKEIYNDTKSKLNDWYQKFKESSD